MYYYVHSSVEIVESSIRIYFLAESIYQWTVEVTLPLNVHFYMKYYLKVFILCLVSTLCLLYYYIVRYYTYNYLAFLLHGCPMATPLYLIVINFDIDLIYTHTLACVL